MVTIRIVSGMDNFVGDAKFFTRERAQEFIDNCAKFGVIWEFVE